MPIALALGACAAPPTLEELEFQALQSGDWSAVEKRERVMARRAEKAGPACPQGAILYCEERAGDQACQCVSRRALNDLLGLEDF